MRKSKNFVLTTFMLITLLINLILPIYADTEQKSNEDDTFVIGLEAAYPPFNWSQLDDSNGAIKIEGSDEYAGGYDVEIAKRVAESLGKKLVVKKIEWTGLVPAVQSGVIDAVMAGMSPTSERKEKIDFSENYYQSTYVLLARKDSDYAYSKSIQDFKGARITAQLGTAHYDIIDQIKGVNKLAAYKNFSAMRVALDSKTIDAYVTEMPEAISSCLANDDFIVVNPEDGFKTKIEDISIAVGLKKDSSLRKGIDEALSKVTEEEREEIMKMAIKNQPISENSESEETVVDGEAEVSKKGFWEEVYTIFDEYKLLYLKGAMWTVIISIIGTCIGFLIGLLMGIIRTIPTKDKKRAKIILIKILNLICNIYITLFRCTPMMVQAMVFYYGLAYGGIHMSPILAGLIVVSVNTGAYMAEIVRGGIVSIDKGQFEAAKAIGMNHYKTMKNIILPQAIRNILPATTNEFIVNVKDTAVLSVISVSELFFQSSTVASSTFSYFPAFTVSIFIYLIMTLAITYALRLAENKMDGPSDYNLVSNQMQLLNSSDILKLKEEVH